MPAACLSTVLGGGPAINSVCILPAHPLLLGHVTVHEVELVPIQAPEEQHALLSLLLLVAWETL